MKLEWWLKKPTLFSRVLIPALNFNAVPGVEAPFRFSVEKGINKRSKGKQLEIKILFKVLGESECGASERESNLQKIMNNERVHKRNVGSFRIFSFL